MTKQNVLLISRLLVGSLFIVSGLIKANDPLGFSYKLEEYFAPDVLNWTIFSGTELFQAAFISIGEIVLGAAFLAGEKGKLSAWLLLLMIIFFSFLTGYTAIGNWFFEHPNDTLTKSAENILGFTATEIHYFKDCGCFGDAIKFTPWNSFVKDLVLMFFAVIIFANRDKVVPNSQKQDLFVFGFSLLLISIFSVAMMSWWFPVWFSAGMFIIMLGIKKRIPNPGWWMGGAAFLYTMVFTVYVIRYIPQKDFRPYAVGQNISNNMVIPEGEEPPLYGVDYTMKNKKTGETFVVNSVNYMEERVWENKELEIIETSESYLIREGYVPPVHDFVLEHYITGEDRTQDILESPKTLLVIAYDLDHSNISHWNQIKALAQDSRSQGIDVVGLSASSGDLIDKVRQEYSLEFDFF